MSTLEMTRLVLLVVHFIALAAIIGPFLLQQRGRDVLRLRLMLTGVVVQVVSGNALIASRRLQGLGVDEIKMIVKLGIAIVTLGLLIAAVVVQRRDRADGPAVRPLFNAAGGLALADVVVAVMW